MIPFARAAILASSLSTQITSIPRSASPAPVTRPTYPVPTMQMFMRFRASRDPLPLPIPFDAPAQAFFEGDPGFEAEEPFRLADVGERHRDVAGLIRATVEDRLLSRGRLDRADQVRERDRT